MKKIMGVHAVSAYYLASPKMSPGMINRAKDRYIGSKYYLIVSFFTYAAKNSMKMTV